MTPLQNQFQVSTGSIQFKAALFNTGDKRSPAPVGWAGLFAKERRETWSLRDWVSELHSTLPKDQ
jgi:hypothetical protein